MAAKRKPRRTDPHRALREHVLELLGKGHAHVTFRDAIAAWPAALRGAKPPGQPFTPWRLLEHIRISQWDIVEFTKSASHVSPEWPAGYWPQNDAPPDAAGWDKSVAQGEPDDERKPPSSHLARACEQLAEYFAKARTAFDLPLDPPGTPFQRRVWSALRIIPYGTTVSYGELARRLGDVRATRAVGAANGKNPIPIIVPCHRVIGARGELTGFGGGLDRKRWLLEHEGALLPLT